MAVMIDEAVHTALLKDVSIAVIDKRAAGTIVLVV
jgi:hypothetical protein